MENTTHAFKAGIREIKVEIPEPGSLEEGTDGWNSDLRSSCYTALFGLETEEWRPEGWALALRHVQQAGTGSATLGRELWLLSSSAADVMLTGEWEKGPYLWLPFSASYFWNQQKAI